MTTLKLILGIISANPVPFLLLQLELVTSLLTCHEFALRTFHLLFGAVVDDVEGVQAARGVQEGRFP